MGDTTLADLLSPSRVQLGQAAPDWEAAVRQVGQLLVEAGAV
jgi:mannitol/fructose-specific phosphotransferase system IIA component (Ntr-type)